MELGAALLVSPHQLAVDWMLLAAGLGVGFALPPPHPFFGAACLGACIFSLSRDFEIPLDATLFAVLPVCTQAWRPSIMALITLAILALGEWSAARPLPHAPRDTWTPAILAALCVAGGSKATKWLRVACVIMRHIQPRGARLAYGALLVVQEPVVVARYDALAGPVLLYTGFALAAMFSYYPLVLCGLGFLSIKGVFWA